jgi:hypothetical protein
VSHHVFSSRAWNRKKHSLGFLEGIVIAETKLLKSLLLPEEGLSLGILPSSIIETSPVAAPHPSPLPREREPVTGNVAALVRAMVSPLSGGASGR